MHHIAIMNPAWKLIPKILSGEKTIESRWYKHKVAPWNRVHAGDVVFFKNSGKPVTVTAEVRDVKQYSDLSPERVNEILKEYGTRDGINNADLPFYFDRFKNKRYCILVFLKNMNAVEQSFHVNKKGYGMQAAWMVVEDIEKIKV